MQVVGSVLVRGIMKFLNASSRDVRSSLVKKHKICVITKPGHNIRTRKKVEKLLKGLGCRVLKNPGGADFCIIIRGDGTLLHEQSGIKAPILGIRTANHVGYYLKANQKDFEKKLTMLLEGRGCFIHKLPRLEALVNGKKLKALALNEVLISPVYCRRMLETRILFKGKKSLERNSGLVIYTPSGSHAFARSLGARKSRFGIIPIAPFSGKWIKKDQALGKSLSVEILSREAELCIDGQENQVWKLRKGDKVLVRRAKSPARIVAFTKKF